jgi:hypothetical protein
MNDKIFGVLAGHLIRSALRTVIRPELLILPERRERIEHGLDLKDDIAAFAAIAAVGSAMGNKFLAMEMHHPIAAFA